MSFIEQYYNKYIGLFRSSYIGWNPSGNVKEQKPDLACEQRLDLADSYKQKGLKRAFQIREGSDPARTRIQMEVVSIHASRVFFFCLIKVLLPA